jgi:hypothetical protein
MREKVEVWAGGEVWETEIFNGEPMLELRVRQGEEWKSYICKDIGGRNKDGVRIFEEVEPEGEASGSGAF